MLFEPKSEGTLHLSYLNDIFIEKIINPTFTHLLYKLLKMWSDVTILQTFPDALISTLYLSLNNK